MSKENMSDQKMEYYTLNAKLCRLVQANPCMYDRSSPNYLRKEYVERAWANIAREVKDSVGSCKERWRNIRTAFARSVNIYKTSSGPNRHKRYYLHDELQFLTKHIAPGLPSLPIRVLSPTELEENHNNSQVVDEPDDDCTFQITMDSSSPPPAVHMEDERVPTPEPEPDCVELPSSPVVKKRKLIDPADFFLINQHRNRDPDSEFLNSILPEMKAMNSRQKILFKGKIFQVLEEIFDDTKDFPNRVEPTKVSRMPTPTRAVNQNAGVSLYSAATKTNNSDVQWDAHTSNVSYNLHIPIVQLDGNVKPEPISVDLDD